jgi:hypothetical protein
MIVDSIRGIHNAVFLVPNLGSAATGQAKLLSPRNFLLDSISKSLYSLSLP